MNRSFITLLFTSLAVLIYLVYELLKQDDYERVEIWIPTLAFISVSIYTFFMLRNLGKFFVFHLNALKEKESVLDDNDHSKALLLSSLSDGVLEYDFQQKKWLTVSSQFKHIFSLNDQQLGDFNHSNIDGWVNLFCKEDHESARTLIENAVKSPLVLEAKLRFLNRNQEVCVIDVIVASWMKNSQHGILTFCHKDITNEIQNEKDLVDAQAKQQTSARLASLGEMASGIAHEINNPLGVITARVALLKPKVKKFIVSEAAEVIIRDLEKIESNSYRIAKIVKGLRTFSRDGNQDPFENFKINGMIDETLSFCMERFKGHGIDLDIQHGPTNELEAKGRMVQLSQVLLNLLNNAFDAVKETPSPCVSLKTWVDDDHMHILIHDSGEGVSPEIEEKIMLPFFTTKEIGVGTGLGLSISQSIMRDHEGRLFLDRKVSPSCFHIEIPRIKGQSILVA